MSAGGTLPPPEPNRWSGAPPSKPPAPSVKWTVEEQEDSPTTREARFYSIDEVDQPAQPVEDWHIPFYGLEALKVRILIFQVWITQEGELLNVRITSSTPELPENHKRQLEQSLMQTEMLPATRSGETVDSQRTIEMALEF
jgi:hypothetical protein